MYFGRSLSGCEACERGTGGEARTWYWSFIKRLHGMNLDVTWQQVSDALDEVWELPADERPAYLTTLAEEAPSVHRQVCALLEAEGEEGGLLDEGLEGFEDLLDGEAPLFESKPLDAGDSLGAYRIIEEVGKGGMGVVYRAERSDGQFEQEVAVKVLRSDGLSERAVQRFLFERQILASLSHPSIARVFDGGVMEDGRPYLIMEYVEGEPITTYCNRHQCTIRDRLQLFTAVCDAVQHAHRNLVVHRDLKPSNILVTAEGHIKLLDFGIAKLLNTEDDASAQLTRTGAPLMTPEYAAPEQVRGEAITTATDVYALGILLYELLTGCRPYDGEERSPYEVMQLVCEREPTRPSTVVSFVVRGVRKGEDGATAEALASARGLQAQSLQQVLRGDLDAIILYALRKEPAHRYSSVQALADDVRNHLQGRAVHARRHSLGYKVRKTIQRHKWAIASATVIALLLIGYATTVTYQARALAEERDRATQEAERAEQVAGFLQDLFRSTDPFGQTSTDGAATDLSARDVVDRGARRLEQLEGQPTLRANLQQVIGVVYVNIGEYDSAAPLLDAAVAHFEAQAEGGAHAELFTAKETQAGMMVRQGRYEEAERLITDLLGRLDTADDFPEDQRIDRSRSLRSLLGLLYTESGEVESAVNTYEELMAEPDIQESPQYQTITHNLAMALGVIGRYQEALPLHEESLNYLHERSNSSEVETLIASVTMAKAFTLQRMGELQQADSLHQVALTTRRKVLGDRHPHVASSLIRIGMIRAAQGRGQEAQALAEEGYDILADYLPEDHWQLHAARGLRGLGLVLQGQVQEGHALLKEAHANFEDTLGPEDWRTQEAREALQRAEQARRLMGG